MASDGAEAAVEPGLLSEEEFGTLVPVIQKLFPSWSSEEIVKWLSTSEQKDQLGTEDAVKASVDKVYVAPVEESKADPIVTRREINSMSEEDQNRFMDAVYKMCENKDGVPGTSEFFRIAGYHGYPSSYCDHGVETFPGWHRAYLAEFEQALRAADVALGNDGNVSLPYWDWTVNQFIPKIARDRWSEWPEGLWPADLDRVPSLRRNSDRTFKRYAPRYRIVEDARDCLLASQHYTHASTGFEWASAYPSIEKSHNSIHVMVGGRGGPMASVSWAAFDIVFWLHHCNVDRIYEGYVRIEEDSHEEFKSFQETQDENRFEQPMEPFKQADGTPWYPKDTFKTEPFGFRYDNVPTVESQPLMVPPTLVMFPNVKITEFEGKCYGIHVFLCEKGEESEAKFQAAFNECKSTEEAMDLAAYAGSAAVFGRGSGCETCRSRGPYDITVDVSKTAISLGLARANMAVKVYCEETTNFDEDAPLFIAGADVAGLPEARLVGALFEQTEQLMDTEKRGEMSGSAALASDVVALQKWLKTYGYYDGAEDADYGPKTAQAVNDFQKGAGITVDSVAGPQTKEALRRKRCANKDAFAANDVRDDTSDAARANLLAKLESSGKKVSYSVGVVPGYLKRDDVLACIGASFAQWAAACGLEFTLVDSPDADIKLTFTNLAQTEDNPTRFDGVGGVLGRGGDGFVQFDFAERWTTDFRQVSDMNDPSTWYLGQPVISLAFTSLHEIGHALGLDHSANFSEVMSPFYNPMLTRLTAGDVSRIRALYGADSASAAAASSSAAAGSK